MLVDEDEVGQSVACAYVVVGGRRSCQDMLANLGTGGKDLTNHNAGEAWKDLEGRIREGARFGVTKIRYLLLVLALQ